MTPLLTAAVFLLAAAVLASATVMAVLGWQYLTCSRLDSLTDEEIAARLAPHVAPLVAAELIVHAAYEDQEPELP